MASSKNIGDQISEAVQSAIASQDYRDLQATVERSIDMAAENIGKGLAQASQSIRRAQEGYIKERERREQRALMQNLYAKTSGARAGGIAMTGWGAVLLVTNLLGAGLLSAGGILFAGSALFAVPPLLLVAAGGGALLFAGVKKLGLVKRFERYRDTIGLREYCTIDELAASSASTPAATVKNVKAMLGKGLFRQAALDDSESFLIMTREAYGQYRQAQNEAQARQRQESLARSVEPAAQAQPLADDARALLQRGEGYVAKIRSINDAIPGDEISRKIDRIECVVRTIFQRAAEQPRVIDDLGKLMDYYLPTTVKLLEAYRDLDAQPIQGESIQASKREIEATLDTLSGAFEKLLDSIFRDVAWDVSTDISVLHTVLAQEGLVDDPFAPKKH